jgi:hypothetical protein
MQRRKNPQLKMHYQISLNSLVSSDNFYRKLEKALDLHFLYALTSPYYGTEDQESIDLVVFSGYC